METVASERGTEILTRFQGKFVNVRTLTMFYLYSISPSVRPSFWRPTFNYSSTSQQFYTESDIGEFYCNLSTHWNFGSNWESI